MGAADSCSPAAIVGDIVCPPLGVASKLVGETESESAPAAIAAASSPNARREMGVDFGLVDSASLIRAPELSELEDDVDTEV